MTENAGAQRSGGEAEPRWLRGGELSAWKSMARVLTTLVPALERQLERDANLNWMEYHALALLSDQEGHTLRMSDLASRAASSLSRLSHVIARLERQGLVYRVPDPQNGRYVRTTLTREGYEKLAAVAPAHVEKVRTLVFDVLEPDELKMLKPLFDRIYAAIEEAERRG
ncbi:MarR family transcriptional regulator [Micromonospora sp. NPDC049559]|uniref:MarR family winged helix-turn-helix transcriptional regulator n=1 Tax=Micromonospora sp. NPDC049559 TaxID=3155923 RepID=UPI00341A3F21